MPEPESKPESKPSEAPPEGTQPQGRGGKYIDYNTLTPEEAAIMLKRIRARIKRIERDLGVIMGILKYGANAYQGQGQGQAQQGQGGYSRGYRRGSYSGSRGGYSGSNYGRGYGRRFGRKTSSGGSEEEEDVNY